MVVSILTLTAISGERYCAICRPLTFKQTRTRVIGCLVVIWVAAHLAAVPRLIIMQLQHDDLVPPNVTVLLTSCVPSPALKAVALHYEVFLCVVFYALPIAVMGYTYTAVAWCLWSSAKTSILTGKGTSGLLLDGGGDGDDDENEDCGGGGDTDDDDDDDDDNTERVVVMVMLTEGYNRDDDDKDGGGGGGDDSGGDDDGPFVDDDGNVCERVEPSDSVHVTFIHNTHVFLFFF